MITPTSIFTALRERLTALAAHLPPRTGSSRVGRCPAPTAVLEDRGPGSRTAQEARRDTTSPWIPLGDFARLMHAHRGIEVVPANRRLQYLADQFAAYEHGRMTLPMAALVISLWGEQILGGHGKSTAHTLAQGVEQAPQHGAAVKWLAEYNPVALVTADGVLVEDEQ